MEGVETWFPALDIPVGTGTGDGMMGGAEELTTTDAGTATPDVLRLTR